MTKIGALKAGESTVKRSLDVQQNGFCFLGAFKHRSHHFKESSVFWFFQSSLHTILHNRNKLLVAELVVV